MKLVIRDLGQVSYNETWQQMKQFIDSRNAQNCADSDEIWLLEHPAVFTQGQAGKAEHLLQPGIIPVVQSDRGGQVTFHGPGQLIVYFLLNIKRLNIGVRGLVNAIEDSVASSLQTWGIDSHRQEGAPGVYVKGAKIASLGLRFRRGYCYHGLSLNVNMDLEPFSRINPCGYQGLEVTQTADWGGPTTVADAAQQLVTDLANRLGYSQILNA